MGERPKNITPLREEPRRLDEIEQLIFYESSIEFSSYRAHESMWGMVEEIRRCWAELEELRTPVRIDSGLSGQVFDGPMSTQEAAERYRDDVVL